MEQTLSWLQKLQFDGRGEAYIEQACLCIHTTQIRPSDARRQRASCMLP